MLNKGVLKVIGYAVSAAGLMLGLYFAILTLVSGWSFAQKQFGDFWYFIVSLAFGFGIQAGLYAYLKSLVRKASTAMLAASGATSTMAMVSCCAHYLVNILPILGVTGIAAIASQYQVRFFWIGIVLNLVGIGYIANRIVTFKQHEKG